MDTAWRNLSKNTMVIGVNAELERKAVAQIVHDILKLKEPSGRINLCKKDNFVDLCKDENLRPVRELYYSPLKGLSDTKPEYKEKCTNPQYFTIVELYDKTNKIYILVY